ncbi:MAG TPA: ECF transporter S component [Thermomicrobiales bacterium]|nr:ECF transporter S component [Thermomicrobiales bacterium]
MTPGAQSRVGGALLAASALAGAAAFLYPFLLPALAGPSAEAARAPLAPLVLGGIAALSVALTLANQADASLAGSGGGKQIAVLGTLVAIDASLRLIPSFAGASPIFALILLAGAAFGVRFGYLMGTMTMLLSAALTGGIGPWLPYQMLGAGWVGLSGALVPRSGSLRRRVAALALLGLVWGFLFGAILNLYAWPFAAPGLQADAGLYWNPSLSLGEAIHRYGAYYLATSFAYDLFRAVGNAALLLAAGAPALRLLERYRRRIAWRPADAAGSEPPRT